MKDTQAERERNEYLRGFEIVRDGLFGREVVYKFKPTELAVKQAAADVKWFQQRSPHLNYELRAIVSVPREPVEDRGADTDPAQRELPLGDDPALNKFRQTADEVPNVEPGQ